MNRLGPFASALLGSGLALCASSPAWAQQTAHAPSGTQPSPGVVLARERVQFQRFDGVDRAEFETILALGITPDLTAMLHVPLIDQHADPGVTTDEGFGVADLDLMLQYRFFKQDLGPLNTRRFTLQAGVEVPTFDVYSSDSFDPFVGVAVTQVIDRHGLGAYARAKINTGEHARPTLLGDTRHDALFGGASYLYRVDPARFTVDRAVGTYLVAELNGVAEADGDYSLWLSPGVMVEAPTWTVELSARLPVLEDVGEARELDWGVTVGVRLLF